MTERQFVRGGDVVGKDWAPLPPPPLDTDGEGCEEEVPERRWWWRGEGGRRKEGARREGGGGGRRREDTVREEMW